MFNIEEMIIECEADKQYCDFCALHEKCKTYKKNIKKDLTNE